MLTLVPRIRICLYVVPADISLLLAKAFEGDYDTGRRWPDVFLNIARSLLTVPVVAAMTTWTVSWGLLYSVVNSVVIYRLAGFSGRSREW